jgi:hypothetical protein
MEQIQAVLAKSARPKAEIPNPAPPARGPSKNAASRSQNPWLEKIWRGISNAGNPGQFLANTRLHLSNLYWLYKINKLKRL